MTIGLKSSFVSLAVAFAVWISPARADQRVPMAGSSGPGSAGVARDGGAAPSSDLGFHSDPGAESDNLPTLKAAVEKARQHDTHGSAATEAESHYWVSYWESYQHAAEHRTSVLRFQLYSSGAIFAVVNLLVLVGVLFSWLQFRVALSSSGPRQKREESGDPGAPVRDIHQLNSTIAVSASGFKVSSPVLGVIILMVSFAFYYAYLKFVYPIHFVNDTPHTALVGEG